MRKIWHLWAKALGPKQGATDREADMVAIVRTAILSFYMITNGFIVASAWVNLTRSMSPCDVYNTQQRQP
jgi:hypothetical protein